MEKAFRFLGIGEGLEKGEISIFIGFLLPPSITLWPKTQDGVFPHFLLPNLFLFPKNCDPSLPLYCFQILVLPHPEAVDSARKPVKITVMSFLLFMLKSGEDKIR